MHCYRCDEWVRASAKRCRCGCVAFYRGSRPAFGLQVIAEREMAAEAERVDKLKGAMLLGESEVAEPIGWREITARRRDRRR